MHESELIESKRSFAAISQAFGNRNEAIEAISDFVCEKHAPGGEKSECELCSHRSDVAEQRMYWKCIVGTDVTMGPLQMLALAFGSVGVTVNTRFNRFVTYHALCDNCTRRIKRRTLFALLCKAMFGLTMFLSIIVFAYSTLMWIMYHDRNPVDAKLLPLLALISGTSVAICFFSVQAIDFWPVRKCFPQLGKRPFIFEGFQPPLD